jgi:hypothetical protein
MLAGTAEKSIHSETDASWRGAWAVRVRGPRRPAPQAASSRRRRRPARRAENRSGAYAGPGGPEAQAQRSWRSGSRGVLTARQGVNAYLGRTHPCHPDRAQPDEAFGRLQPVSSSPNGWPPRQTRWRHVFARSSSPVAFATAAIDSKPIPVGLVADGRSLVSFGHLAARRAQPSPTWLARAGRRSASISTSVSAIVSGDLLG